MQDCNVISKGNYADFRFNEFVSVKQYLLIKEKSKKYLLLKFGNDGKETVTGLKLTVKELDVRGNLVGTRVVFWDGVNGKPGTKFVGKEKIALDDTCVEVKIDLDAAIFGDYVYSVKGKELVVTYEKKPRESERAYPTELGEGNVVSGARSFRAPWVVVLVSLAMLFVTVFGTIFHLISFKEEETEFLWSGVEYSFVDGNKSKGSPVVVTGQGDIGTLVNIPAKIEGHPVVAIDSNAFKDNTKLKKLTIEGNIYLEPYAFSGCTSLTSVELVEVSSIGEYAFANCRKMESFTAKNLDSIGDYAFSGCKNLKTLNISHEEKILSIGTSAFADCTNLKNLTLDQAVEYPNALRLNYFGSCDKLETLHLKNYNCTDYESSFAARKALSDLFAGSALTALKELTIDYIDEVPANFCSNKAQLKTVKLGGLKKDALGASAFRDCIKLETLELSLPITEIGNYALSGTKITAFNGEALTKIGDGAFAACADLASVSLKDNAVLSSVGSSAFKNCSSLVEIYIPEGVEDFKASVFEGCGALTKVEFAPNNALRSVGENAFWGCVSLSSVAVPETVTSIGAAAFKNCTKLTAAVMPASLHTIGENAFENCSALTVASVPSGVTSIGLGTFAGCKALAELSVPFLGGSATSNRYLSYLFGAESQQADGYTPSSLKSVVVQTATDISEYAFYCAEGLSNISLPVGLSSVGNYAFANCESLTAIPVLDGVTQIGSYAFSNCSALRTATLPSSVTEIGESAFDGCSGLKELTVPFIGGTQDSNDSMDYLFGYTASKSLEKVTVTAETAVGYQAFKDFSGLKRVVLPEGVHTIAEGAFENCYSLRTINLPSTLWLVSDNAFANCYTLFEIYNLSELTLEYGSSDNGGVALNALSVYESYDEKTNGLETEGFAFLKAKKDDFWYLTDRVGESGYWDMPDEFVTEGGETVSQYDLLPYLFNERSDVESLYISSAVRSIGSYAFNYCENLTKVEYAEDGVVQTVHSATFYGCSALESAVLAGDIENIDEGAFYGCVALEEVRFSAKLKNIARSAFEKCASLQAVELPATLVEIGDYAFSDCTTLQEATFPDSLEKIGVKAFNNCSSLEAARFGNRLAEIGREAFNGCVTLTEVEFGPSIATLGESAFAYCESLERVTFHDDCPLQSILYATFTYCSGLQRIELPSNINVVGQYAFSGCSALESIVLPASLTSIENGAFDACGNLYEVYNLSDLPISIETSDYGNVAYNAVIVHTDANAPSLKTLKYNDLVFKVSGDFCCLIRYEGAAESLSLSKVTLEGKRYDSYWIRHDAFNGNSTLKKVELRDAVTGLGKNAFASCYNLETVLMSNSRISVISENAFAWCGALKEVECSSLTERIEDFAFTDCPSLRSFTVKNLVNYIGMGAFNYCYRLWEVYDLSSHISVNKGDFEGNGGIGAYALKVNQSASVAPIVYTTVDAFEFFRMDNVWYLYQRNFGDSNLLLPESFSYDGKTVTSYKIYKNAFEANVVYVLFVPDSVTEIMEKAFYDASVQTVYFEGTKAKWESVCSAETAGLSSARIYYYSTCVHADDVWTYRNGEISTAHEELEWKIKTASTCKKQGVEQGTCPYCDHKEERSLALGEHKFNEDGKCTVCNKVKIKITAKNFKTYFENESYFPFEIDENGKLTSTNKEDSSSAVITCTATAAMEISFEYSVSSEKIYDCCTVSLNGETQAEWSGTSSGSYSVKLSVGDIFTIEYAKDSSGSSGNDCVTFGNIYVIK
ncbi:MAG: leucine-rich repeat domain-containing protein [Clostridia bacterium]|nr:leucine-rich repeat domain-containing protein [Clostridia bacterium]